MKKILVLGSGMVGSAMALDMAKRHRVTVTDIHPPALESVRRRADNLKISAFPDTDAHKNHKKEPSSGSLVTLRLDVTDTGALRKALSKVDLVISAVPGFLGYRTLQTAIEAGRDIVDISFFPENALELNDLALENGVTAIVDCGVAPGMGNLLLGYHDARLTVTSFKCMVGGLPKVKQWPYCYKAPFSPVDVIEEYVRPARLVENGALVTREALSDPELIDFDGIGTLEAFNTDGLRTLIHTMPHIPDMKEKTLRYPGHIEYIRVLKASGFFGEQKVRLADGVEVRPLDLTSRLLFDQWRLGDEEEEFTVMRVVIGGYERVDHERVESEKLDKNLSKKENSSVQITITYDLLDEYCPETRTSSMARTTGYTATAAANMLLDGLCTEKGLLPPERIGSDETCFRYIMDYLTERGVNLTST